MIGRPTLQSTLFRSFSAVMVAIMLLLIAFFFFYTRRILLEHSTEAIEDVVRAISSDQDEEIRKLDTVSMNTAYSEMVSEGFQTYQQSSDGSSSLDRRSVASAITAIVGPQVTVKQVYLYDLRGGRLAVGMINNSDSVVLSEQGWYDAVMRADGKKILTGPSIDETLSAAYVNQRDRQNVVLHRLFFDRYRTPVGIMELVQDSARVFISADTYESRGEGSVLVIDNEGNLLYPTYYPSPVPSALLDRQPARRGPSGSFLYQSAEGPLLAAFAVSDYTGWTTVVSQDKSRLLVEANAFSVLTLAVILPALLAVLGMSLFASRRITRPLRVIHETVESMDLASTGSGETPVAMPVNELEELLQAILAMREKLRTSISETIAAHRHESEARMQALQAQVNPHFLHNTINTLSAMAEERMYDDIVLMCRNVSAMMRYVADEGQTVSLVDEIEYSRNYLETMKLRFREQLKYEISLDGDGSTIDIPRLVIQPLVENAIKHGTTRRSPWTVEVTGQVTPTRWQVTVRDNGPGFDARLVERVNQWSPTDDGIEETGIGIENIMHRLGLWYGSAGFSFSIRNLENGAEVTVGGPVNPVIRLANGEEITNG